MSHEDEPATGIRWHCNDGLDPDLIFGELVFPPIFTLIRTEQDIVRGLLVIGVLDVVEFTAICAISLIP